MQNEQQTSLSTGQATIHSHPYQQLQKKLASESKIKNICIIVIIAIIATNFMQARNLKSNYQNLEDLVDEVVKSIRDNKRNIQKEQEQRIGNLTEVSNALEKKIGEMKEKMQSLEKTFTDEESRLGNKLVKYQETINKMRKELERQQDSVKHVDSSGPSKAVPQTVKKQQATVSFVFQQLKEEHHESKTKWLKSMLDHETLKDEKAKTAFMTAFSNIKLRHENVLSQKQSRQLDQAIHKRLLGEYKLNDYSTELPFCIVVPTYNNAKDFRYEYNLQSILNLNYSNYKVVIVDDASTDGTPQLLTQLIASLQTTISIHLVRNEVRVTAVPNINKAIREYCQQTDIAVLVDGDDELLVRDSLKVFNAVYQQKKVDVVYSNHLKLYWHQNDVFKGWSAAYSAEEVGDNSYRDVPQKISHLRSFKVALFLEVKEEDMKDEHGSWFGSTYDEVLLLPVLEMSCGRIAFVEEYFYMYNFGIGTNDLMVDEKKQKEIADLVKHRKKKYQCLNRK